MPETIDIPFKDGKKRLQVKSAELTNLFTPYLVEAREFLLQLATDPDVSPAFTDDLGLLDDLANRLSFWPAGALGVQAHLADEPLDALDETLDSLEEDKKVPESLPEQLDATLSLLQKQVILLKSVKPEQLSPRLAKSQQKRLEELREALTRGKALGEELATGSLVTASIEEQAAELMDSIGELRLASMISPSLLHIEPLALELLAKTFEPEEKLQFVFGLPWVSARSQQTLARFKELTTEMYRRFVADWPDIRTFFFNGAHLRLKQLQPTSGDPHKGGRLVQKMVLRTSDNVVFLIYKPADLELDYLLVGSSIGLGVSEEPDELRRAYQPTPFGRRIPSFLELLNELLTASGNIHLRQEPYRILPRFPGSRLKRPEGGGPLPIECSYGYSQFLEGADPKNPHSPAIWQNHEQAPAQWGCLAAMGVLVSLSDMHRENVIFTQSQPTTRETSTSSSAWTPRNWRSTSRLRARSSKSNGHRPSPPPRVIRGRPCQPSPRTPIGTPSWT